MIKFYKLVKVDGETGPQVVHLREEGFFLPNNCALEMAVYRSKDDDRWYVVELTSGAGLGEGDTRKKAVANFEHNVERVGVKGIENAVRRSIELYGRTPDHEATEAF